MTVVEYAAARLALYNWAAKYPHASPYQDYGFSAEDMAADPMTWSERDGQMLKAFLGWWNKVTGDTEPVTTELSPSALHALQKASLGTLVPTNPAVPGVEPPPAQPAPTPPPPPPPAIGPLPAPPEPVPAPTAPPNGASTTVAAKDKKEGLPGWVWALGTAVVVGLGYVFYTRAEETRRRTRAVRA